MIVVMAVGLVVAGLWWIVAGFVGWIALMCAIYKVAESEWYP
jgi:hypothetical protein